MSERQSKSTQDRHERMLNEIVKNPGNENCADCNSKNPRWASYSLGVFLCIRCAGIHRKMGTHVSKVKSITMDQWTPEQIDMMRKSGGNRIVNSKINPNPGNHPLPLTADSDDHVMERYIRSKWEKRLFMTDNRIATPPKSSPANPISRLQVLPKRSSSVPTITATHDPLMASLNKLRDMGFRDEVKNKQVLIQTQGNLDAAIEIMTRNASTPPIENVFLTDDQKNEQLMKLGFVDRNSNIDALRRSGGNLDIAITILNDTKNIRLQQNGIAGQVIQSPSQQQQSINFRPQLVAVKSNSNNLVDVQSTSVMKDNNDLFNNPFGINIQQQQMQQMQQQQMLQQQQLQQQQLLQQQQQHLLLQQQQQQQFMPQQPQQTNTNNLFNNPFGLSTPTANTTSVFNTTPQQQAVKTLSSNPFSQMTASPYTNNNTSYFQPTNDSLFNQTPYQQQQAQYQQPQQQVFSNANNPWSTGSLF